MNQYALILAGGSGTRFWPLSRDHRPKQLLNMFGEGTLLRQAIDRLDGLVPRQNIFILTNHLQEAEVRRQAHDIPVDNIISEPVRRDTAPAIALGIGLIKAADPHGVMLVIPSDHLIQDQDSFRTLMKAAMDTAAREKRLSPWVSSQPGPAPPTATLNAEKKSTPLRAVPAAKSFNSAKTGHGHGCSLPEPGQFLLERRHVRMEHSCRVRTAGQALSGTGLLRGTRCGISGPAGNHPGRIPGAHPRLHRLRAHGACGQSAEHGSNL